MEDKVLIARKHINDDHIRHKLYRKGLNFIKFQGLLNEIVSPIYQSAKNSGFENWVLTEE